jgi:hypothetical protein
MKKGFKVKKLDPSPPLSLGFENCKLTTATEN